MAVAGAHVLLLVGLLNWGQTPVWQSQMSPLMVTLIRPTQPAARRTLPKLEPAQPRDAPATVAPPIRRPEAQVQRPDSAVDAPLAPPPAQPALTVSGSPTSASPLARLPLPVPPERQPLLATAAHYLTAPPAEVPRLSRRAGESGTVWLRVRVDASGWPVQVQLHRSSGFARLDEQALWAMRQARFKPHTEAGQAVEVEVIAPIEYPPE